MGGGSVFPFFIFPPFLLYYFQGNSKEKHTTLSFSISPSWKRVRGKVKEREREKDTKNSERERKRVREKELSLVCFVKTSNSKESSLCMLCLWLCRAKNIQLGLERNQQRLPPHLHPCLNKSRTVLRHDDIRRFFILYNLAYCPS